MYTFGGIEALSHFWTPRKKGTPGKRKLRIATSTNFLSLLHRIKRGTAGNKISLLNLSTWDNGFYTHFPSAHNPARIPPASLSLSLTIPPEPQGHPPPPPEKGVSRKAAAATSVCSSPVLCSTGSFFLNWGCKTAENPQGLTSECKIGTQPASFSYSFRGAAILVRTHCLLHAG